MFPQRLDSPLAYDIAKAMMDGFNRHYRLFRTESARAKHRFETADWHGQQRAQRERIEFYDLRVREAVTRLEKEFKAGEQPMEVWQQVKLHYIGLLIDHHQPELAETFFNSVTTKILKRAYFQNDFIFVRPAVSTEYIENDEPTASPTYRCYYPTAETLPAEVLCLLRDFDLRGKQIQTGQMVMLSVCGANHDPAVYENPEMLDLDRGVRDVMTFGNGPHYCLGANLAREEIACMLDALLDVVPPGSRVCSEAREYRDMGLFRSAIDLPVQIGPRA